MVTLTDVCRGLPQSPGESRGGSCLLDALITRCSQILISLYVVHHCQLKHGHLISLEYKKTQVHRKYQTIRTEGLLLCRTKISTNVELQYALRDTLAVAVTYYDEESVHNFQWAGSTGGICNVM